LGDDSEERRNPRRAVGSLNRTNLEYNQENITIPFEITGEILKRAVG